MKEPRFTSDWFTVWIPTWEKHLLPRISKVPNAHWLEVGSYEGRSALWTLDHLLTGENAKLTCVDAWAGTYERLFDSNVAKRTNVRKVKGFFHVAMASLLPSHANSFDGAYLDDSHVEVDTLANAEMTWKLLKNNAPLVFDDYDNKEYPGATLAIDAFLSKPDVCYEVIFRGPPLHRPAHSCHSQQIIVLKKG